MSEGDDGESQGSAEPVVYMMVRLGGSNTQKRLSPFNLESKASKQ